MLDLAWFDLSRGMYFGIELPERNKPPSQQTAGRHPQGGCTIDPGTRPPTRSECQGSNPATSSRVKQLR